MEAAGVLTQDIAGEVDRVGSDTSIRMGRHFAHTADGSVSSQHRESPRLVWRRCDP
jgi:hypothetical protein